MGYQASYAEGSAPAQQDKSGGWLLLEFGTNWCGHCMAAQPALKQVLTDYPQLKHIKEEDGPGRKLGRYFKVKLWPTLVLLQDGEEVARLVRPTTEVAIRGMLEAVIGKADT